MKNQLLPIGSVVSLEGAEKKLMIIGSAVRRENDKTLYDYMGVPFPEGYIDSDTMFLFMAKDIAQIHFMGYINSEVQAFKIEYAKYLEENGLLETK